MNYSCSSYARTLLFLLVYPILGRCQTFCGEELMCTLVQNGEPEEVKTEISLTCNEANYSVYLNITHVNGGGADHIRLGLICSDQTCVDYTKIDTSGYNMGETITGSRNVTDAVECALIGCYEIHNKDVPEVSYSFTRQNCTLNAPTTIDISTSVTTEVLFPATTDLVSTMETLAITAASDGSHSMVPAIAIPIALVGLFISLVIGVVILKLRTTFYRAASSYHPNISFKDEFDYHFQPVPFDGLRKYISESQPSLYSPLHKSFPHDLMASSLCGKLESRDRHPSPLPLDCSSGYDLVHNGEFKSECNTACDKRDDVIVHNRTGVLYHTRSIKDGSTSATFSSNNSDAGICYIHQGDSPVSLKKDSLSTYLDEYAVSFEFKDHSSASPPDGDRTAQDSSGYTTEIFTDIPMNMDELQSCEREFVMGLNGYVLPLNQ